MSLSSFLLPGTSKGKAKAIDKGLDDLFRSNPSVPARPGTVPAPSATNAPATSSERKRKATEATPNGKVKRSKFETAATPSSSKRSAKAVTKAAHAVTESDSEEEEDEDEDSDGIENENESEDADEDDAEGEEVKEASSESDDEGDPSKLVHESLHKGVQPKGQSRHGKPKFIPSEETPEQRDARTIFVGNVAVEVTKSRPSQKQFKRHILSFVPSAKIESVRYRSVAFKKPTAELPDDSRKTSHSHSDPKKPSKGREHDRDRAATWRANEGEDDEAAAAPQKQYLTPKEKKRLAFIKHEIHEHVDAVNAYVVFAHPPSAEALAKRPANLPPPAPVMDPYDAASSCAEKGDGSAFMGRTLRVDVVKKGARPREDGCGEGEHAAAEKAMAGDPKAMLFVGNLEFTSKEEDLRAFFESVVTEERGKPGQKAGSGSDDEEDEESDGEGGEEDKPRAWVKRVRIIRDKDTQLGKGFAYVQFADRECIDEILAFEQTKLKFAKRKLRVQRCKTLPGGPKLRVAKVPRTPSSSASGPHGKPSRTGTSPSRPERAPRLVPTRAPKGNSELGAKLAHLPKEERKKAKAADADRVARRLAKKRAKSLAEKGVKSKGDRERVRKRTSERKEGGRGAQGKKDKPKKRVRSGNAMMKMNTKK
ncbi:hypothetical protein GSI_15323 [Ganoderma sinense ZZ0214-1]|uniref:Nucleolar protein 12 n=1 Tax=Ganoderma sinense ZZ0214-1 TaxID=1077348 RepID=A0A2G8RM98_9APHY|nr:hypothetical protein GSI_15323 [Ganoderma sinense ZZ0214-1]